MKDSNMPLGCVMFPIIEDREYDIFKETDGFMIWSLYIAIRTYLHDRLKNMK